MQVSLLKRFYFYVTQEHNTCILHLISGTKPLCYTEQSVKYFKKNYETCEKFKI